MALPQPAAGSDWTVETLRQHMLELLAVRDRTSGEMDRKYQERFEAQKEAIAAAFLAQQTAMQTALTAAERAVAAALLAAKEAVNKAEMATDKRLAAMNEFRGAVQDVLAGAMPRGEAEVRLNAVIEKLAEQNVRADAAMLTLTTALNVLGTRITAAESRTGGRGDSARNLVIAVGLGLTGITVLVSIIGLYLAFAR